jgi:isopenicillin-N N-acyltransferase-like protein
MLFRRYFTLLLTLILLPPIALAAGSRSFSVVVLEGSPRQRGLTHGRTLRRQIVDGIAAWKAGLEQSHHMDADLFIKGLLAKTNFVPAIQRWTPDLIEEVRGIAEGSGVDFDTIFAFQLLDESWAHAKRVTEDHCSALGMEPGAAHPSAVAQNMDLEGFRDGFQTVLHIKQPSGLENLVFTQAGLIALNGVNNRGVGVVVNTLAQLSFSSHGLPVAFVIRGVLARSSRQDAVEFLKQVSHASGQNYIIGGPDKVSDFEASSRKVVALPNPAGGPAVYHTNHPLANDDYHPEYRELLSKKAESKLNENSHARYDALKRHLEKSPAGDLVPWIGSVLGSRDSQVHPVCRRLVDKNMIFTFGSVIMLLSGAPEIWISAGPPDQNPYQRFTFAGSAR